MIEDGGRISTSTKKPSQEEKESLTSLSQSEKSQKLAAASYLNHSKPKTLGERYLLSPKNQEPSIVHAIPTNLPSDDYKQRYLHLECEYNALRTAHAYELSKLRFAQEEAEMRWKDKLGVQLADQARRHNEERLQKELQINILERKVLE